MSLEEPQSPKPQKNLRQRSIESVAWNSITSVAKVLLLFIRAILLSRWLPKATFGTYATASLIIALTLFLPSFGMNGAFLHRDNETEDENKSAAVHFTLKLIFTLIWAILLTLGILQFTSGITQTTILILIIPTAIIELAETPKLILVRRVVHRRLALLQTINVFCTSIVAIFLAWKGYTIAALIATDITAMIITIIMLYIWKPVWRPRLAWSRPTVKYYLQFGFQNFMNAGLRRALDNIDDFWVRLNLGNIALADYSRAYTFATYPSRIIAMPINLVAGGTYAELKDNRGQLSRTFFRTNAFLIRSSCLLGGLMALIAPEFIRLLLTEKWISMLDAFRLMLLFTMLDPIKLTIAHLFIAVGKPQQIVRARTIQLVILIILLFALGLPFGIVGVAIAVDIMLLIGIVYMLWQAKAYVDFSASRLFLIPTFAMILSIIAGASLTLIPNIPESDWYSMFAKSIGFCTVYTLTLFIFEREQIQLLFLPLIKNLLGKTSSLWNKN